MPEHLTPTTPLADGEAVLHSFTADRMAYLRAHAWMALGAMIAGMLVLYLMGNPHVWTGAVGGLAAIAVRGGYLASDELKVRWDLTDHRLMGPQMRIAALSEIKDLNVLGSAVQVVTKGGDKHMIKYQDNRDATRDAILAAMMQGAP